MAAHAAVGRRLGAGGLILLAALVACREGRVRPPAVPVAHPADTMPPERLYGAPPADNLQLRPVEIEVPGLPAGWEGARFLVLSDLHLGLWPENAATLRAALRAGAAAGAEGVLLLGQTLTRDDRAAADTLARVLAQRSIPLAVAVLGPGDLTSDSLRAHTEAALAAGRVRVLRGERLVLVRRGDSLAIVGFSAPAEATAGDARYAWRQLPRRDSLLGLALLPRPDYGVGAPPGRVGALLSGWAHCTRVPLPWAPARTSWEAGLLRGRGVPGVPGLYRLRGNPLLVPCGLGYGFVPMRVGAPPEALLVRLRRVLPPDTAAPADTAGLDTLLRRFQRPRTRDTAAADSAR